MLEMSNDLGMLVQEVVHGLNDMSVLGEPVFLHHGEEPVDHLVRMSGGMSDDRMELMHKSVVGDEGVHLVMVHPHIPLHDACNFLNPAVFTAMHFGEVCEDDLGEPLGVLVELEDLDDFGKQLLLVQVVELKGGVHPVDDGVLVNKSGKLMHDLFDQVL